MNATLADAVGRERNSIQWKLEAVGPLKFSVRNIGESETRDGESDANARRRQ